ncbi:hypothetical protein [Streptomyces lichenis]|uniref:Uncharacterized protein n=1 Tax=Streptomyces lichenis TaxID=2306967 RepID=A0ABT0I587_9ACTN|nr:hypothetical protein [Streptomyces lichenis]MCK8676470.1 hypothetical protein [Streptomyces lichenis]
MASAAARCRRLAAALALLLGALLLCGPYAAGAGHPAEATASSSSHEAAPSVPAAEVLPAEALAAEPAGTPGCHDSGDDRAARLPAVPPRSGSPLADLPHLSATARAVAPGWAAQAQTAARVRAERGPPELVGPTPVELAVLRV